MPSAKPNFDFDTPLAQRGAHTAKWDSPPHHLSGRKDLPDDAISMWIADMDFAAMNEIRTALTAEAERGYLGYFGDAGPVSEAVTGWLARRHDWQVDPSWVRYTTGVIGGLTVTLHAFTNPGDRVVVFSPVYHAFHLRIRAMEREVHESPLLEKDGHFEMDLDALEASLSDKDKAVILCSPHNPGGRIWSKEEISQLADFCAAHDLLLISDEIHMDLCFPGAEFSPTAVAAPHSVPQLITLTAASKGFNIAGGECGIAIIPDPKIRAEFDTAMRAVNASPNRFGMVMLKAAFTHGDDWSDAVCAYIAENFALWRDRINAIPGLSVMDMPSTYLSWVDFSGTGMDQTEIEHRVTYDARLFPSTGPDFGTGGELHMRFNIALPRATLMKAIERMEAAFGDLQ